MVHSSLMYIHWADHLIHRINAILSFSVNGLLLFVLYDDKKIKLGDYRYLIMIFAMFNLINTCADNLIPLKSVLGTIMISVRCSLISATYGILHSHFVYRYMALFRSKFLTNYFIPYGLLLTVLNCILPMAIWIAVCYLFLNADDERRLYMQKEIMENYEGDVFDANILVALYEGGSEESMLKSWIGILTISAISVASVITDIVLGTLIVKKLGHSGLMMSDKMIHVQKQFMKALTVQVTVPMLASLAPCLYAWYKPMFNISAGQWIDAIDVIAISFFPVLDPLALFYFVPAFNNRVKQIFTFVKNRNYQRRGSVKTMSTRDI